MKAIFLSLLTLIAVGAKAQSVKLLEANRQDWSGGIAGRHGSNFRFVIKFPAGTVPDSLWIEDKVIALTAEPGASGFYKLVNKGSSTIAEITAGIAKDDYADRHGLEPGREAPKPVLAPIMYHGVAVIQYTIGGKKKYYTIQKFLSFSPPVNYP